MSDLTYEEIKTNIKNKEFKDWNHLIFNIVNLYNKYHDINKIQDIILRLMERRSELAESNKILDHLTGELGLFPYLNSDNFDFKDQIRQSIFSAPAEVKKTFHIKQAEVFNLLSQKESVVLSAPTSFGKSLIIESIIASNTLDNIVIVVPTIALIDELKTKFFKYKDKYKIITQSTQKPTDRNVFIFTQERVLECPNIIDIDFFVIDEFYKLSPSSSNDPRCDRLNLAFHKLHKICKFFYMLGPNINGLADGVESNLKCHFLKFDGFNTVATDEHYYPVRSTGNDKEKDVDRDKHLFEILERVKDEQTVIYCKSPQRASSVMSKIISLGILNFKNENEELAKWLRESYHRNWSLATAVESGVACHHAKLPRALASLIVEWFNKSKINILVCTSTLIEGVNTNARNIIIYDDCITGRSKLDAFTFNNIAGRSGRMFEHFVGDVYILGDKPQQELPLVDIPVVSQNEDTSDSILLQISDEISDKLKNKISKYTSQKILPVEVLNKHQGISPEKLLSFAEQMIENCGKWNKLMCWNGGYPTKYELNHLCEILKENFNVTRLGGGSVRTAAHLSNRLRDIMSNKTEKEMIKDEYLYRRSMDKAYEVDNAVQVIFEFKRNVVSYNLPRMIYAINDIQRIIFERFKYNFGDYTLFAGKLESFFEHPSIVVLEEFGIPFEVAKKVIDNIIIEDDDDIDCVMTNIKENYEKIIIKSEFSNFEKYMLERAIKFF
jgi:replicative superfamily II helicase